MSNQEYVDSCNLNQLYDLQERVDRRIAAITESPKILLWSVSDDIMFYKYFREEDFKEAVKFMAATILEESTYPDTNRWEICQHKVSQETLHEYDIWEAK